MKKCKICKIEKPINEFYHGLQCKSCLSIEKKKYYQSNKEKINEHQKKYQKDYQFKNKERIKEKNKEKQKSKKLEKLIYYEANKEKIEIEKVIKKKLNKKIYYEANKEKIKEKIKERFYKKLKKDELFRLTHNIRNLIKNSIKRKNYNKKSKSVDILGCSLTDFKMYLENKFEPYMSWENYGKYNGELNYGWDIDHIIPVSSATTEEEIIKLNHYTNLQPMCSKINRDIKKNKK